MPNLLLSGKGEGGKGGRGESFEPLPKLDFQQLLYFQYFGVGVKINQVLMKRSMVISADIFAVFFCDILRVLVGI